MKKTKNSMKKTTSVVKTAWNPDSLHSACNGIEEVISSLSPEKQQELLPAWKTLREEIVEAAMMHSAGGPVPSPEINGWPIRSQDEIKDSMDMGTDPRRRASNKIQITKYASGWVNTPSLPGQMFKTQEELVKAVKVAWPWSKRDEQWEAEKQEMDDQSHRRQERLEKSPPKQQVNPLVQADVGVIDLETGKELKVERNPLGDGKYNTPDKILVSDETGKRYYIYKWKATGMGHPFARPVIESKPKGELYDPEKQLYRTPSNYL
jgi:hypothetical protein